MSSSREMRQLSHNKIYQSFILYYILIFHAYLILMDINQWETNHIGDNDGETINMS